MDNHGLLLSLICCYQNDVIADRHTIIAGFFLLQQMSLLIYDFNFWCTLITPVVFVLLRDFRFTNFSTLMNN